MTDCIFCKIVQKEIPAAVVYEDDDILAFEDINPLAPIHILIIPKKHIPTTVDLKDADFELIAKIHRVALHIGEKMNLLEKGFRLVNNCKEDGGQVVFHIHYHFLAGKKLQTFA